MYTEGGCLWYVRELLSHGMYKDILQYLRHIIEKLVFVDGKVAYRELLSHGMCEDILQYMRQIIDIETNVGPAGR